MEVVTNRELRQLSEGQKAACAVTEFVWPGIVTSLLYGNAEMTEDLVDDMWGKQRRMAVLWTGSISHASGRTSNLSQTRTFGWLATSLQNRVLPPGWNARFRSRSWKTAITMFVRAWLAVLCYILEAELKRPVLDFAEDALLS